MEALKRLPKVDEILNDKRIENCKDIYPRSLIVNEIRASIDEIRNRVLGGEEYSSPFSFVDEVIKRVILNLENLTSNKLKRVVNATGIVIHTNLGRSLLCEEGIKNVIQVSKYYSNLEYNLNEGVRGSRYDNLMDYLKLVTGAEDIVVVNNNAAAVLLVLNSLCKNKEAIISRGELVEIGGSFRIPEIMELSGGVLKEIGTTNRTHLKDYENAIDEDTGVVLKVHTSNYKIMGFTKEVKIEELKDLCKENNIPLVEDLGSGLLTKLDVQGIEEETVKDKINKGVDIITFSGDKLLGGPQCGIIVGKKQFINKIRSNPLNRALRVDKFTLAALEGTLKEYILKKEENIPTIKMLKQSDEEIKNKIEELYNSLKVLNESWILDVMKDKTYVGGGALPMVELPTYILTLENAKINESKIERALREYFIPIITRINKGKVIIDGRTLLKGDIEVIKNALLKVGGVE